MSAILDASESIDGVVIVVPYNKKKLRVFTNLHDAFAHAALQDAIMQFEMEGPGTTDGSQTEEEEDSEGAS